ncbi:MAG: potassium channel protein [Myxococcota bacterium]
MGEIRQAARRLALAFALLAATYAIGTFGYWLLGQAQGKEWTLANCAYMTVILISTVGFTDPLGVGTAEYGPAFTSFVLMLGWGITVYAASVLTTFMVEGQFLELRRRRRMQQQIDRTSGHVIVCGAGTTGRYILEELLASGRRVVAIESQPERIERLLVDMAGLLIVTGDSTDDATLKTAGIDRAQGLIACLSEDPDNLFVVIAARQLNPNLRIVAKAVGLKAADKLRQAGADSVVTPAYIGGLRLASEAMRPHVVEFLDIMMRDKAKRVRFEEITIGPGSPLVGCALGETEVSRAAEVAVIATRNGGGSFSYGPRPDVRLNEGMTLILVGEAQAVEGLRTRLARGPDGAS